MIRQIICPKPNVAAVHMILYSMGLMNGLLVLGIALALTVHGEISVATCNQAFAYHLNFPQGTNLFIKRFFSN